MKDERQHCRVNEAYDCIHVLQMFLLRAVLLKIRTKDLTERENLGQAYHLLIS